MPIIQEKIHPDSIIYSDSLPTYIALDVIVFKHFRINHGEVVCRQQESYKRYRKLLEPSQAPLLKSGGTPKDHFHLHLKEMGVAI